MEQVTLYFRQGSSDKVYQPSIEQQNGGYVVNFAFGRRGTTLQTGTKTQSPVSYDEAKRIFDKLVNEKTAKGYTPGLDGTPYQLTDKKKRVAGFMCQLLNPIDESEATRLIGDAAFCLQEKLDGKRLLLERRGEAINGINRLGLFVGVPEPIAAAARKLPVDCVLDGEAVGETLHVFDLLKIDGSSIQRQSYQYRYRQLGDLVGKAPGCISLVPNKIRVLWADDQADVQETLASVLGGLCTDISHVADAESALRKLQRESFDVLILDLKMPPGEWGGLWLLEEMQRSKINVATLVLSGQGTQHETIKALRYGATDYVTKDEAEKELAGRILDVLRKDGPAPRLRRLIEGGESSQFECKETLRWNVHAGRFDKIPELAVAKTLSAFANTNGGTLVIGVKNDATVVGLTHDNFVNRDAALLHLDNVIKTFLTDAVSHLFQAQFVELSAIDVLRIDSKAATKPVYLTPPATRDVEFYIRRQASSIKLKLDEAIDYIRERFWANSRDSNLVQRER